MHISSGIEKAQTGARTRLSKNYTMTILSQHDQATAGISTCETDLFMQIAHESRHYFDYGKIMTLVDALSLFSAIFGFKRHQRLPGKLLPVGVFATFGKLFEYFLCLLDIPFL